MSRMNDVATPLAYVWWIRLPLAARRVSMNLALTLVDGIYMTAWPRVAAVAPAIILFAGLLIGWLHPGFQTVFSESLLLILFAAFLGVMSGNLGVLFLVGFVVGDFFLAHTAWTTSGGLIQHVLRIRIPLLIEYSLLGFVTTTIPVMTKTLLAQLTPPAALGRPVRLGIAVIGHLVITIALVFLWTQIVPILIRPVFTWPGGSPPTQAMEPLQTQTLIVLVIAGVASLVRMGVQALTASTPAYASQLVRVEEQLASAEPVVPAATRLPTIVVVGGTALWSTLILAGMVQAWLDAIVLFVVILLLQAARAGLLPVPLGRWPDLIERIPSLVRLVAGVIILYFLADVILQRAMRTTNSFRPILFLTIVALVVFYLLNPGLQTTSRTDREEQPA